MGEKADRSVDTWVDALRSESVNLSVAEIGSRIKEARRVLGLTQDQLATKAGAKSKSGLQDNEAGKNMPGGQMIGTLVFAGINANWLMTGEGPMLLVDLVKPVPPPRMNIPALTAIIDGLLKAGAPLDKAVAAAFEFYQINIDRGLITPDGIGTERKSAA